MTLAESKRELWLSTVDLMVPASDNFCHSFEMKSSKLLPSPFPSNLRVFIQD